MNKLVRENLVNFERGKDPKKSLRLGENSLEFAESIFKQFKEDLNKIEFKTRIGEDAEKKLIWLNIKLSKDIFPKDPKEYEWGFSFGDPKIVSVAVGKGWYIFDGDTGEVRDYNSYGESLKALKVFLFPGNEIEKKITQIEEQKEILNKFKNL